MIRKKFIIISCFLIFLLISIQPVISAQTRMETTTPLLNKMTLAYIKIDGYGSSFIIAGDFVLGFGSCDYMRFKLDDFSHIEINKFLDKNNQFILDGNNIITIFGFVGYYRETSDSISLNGFTALILCR